MYVTQKEVFRIILIVNKLLAKDPEGNTNAKAMNKINECVPEHFKRMVKHTTLYFH